MIRSKIILTILVIACISSIGFSQEDTTAVKKDSVNIALLESYNKRLHEIENQRIADSIQKNELEQQLSALKTTDNLKKEELQAQLIAINEKENSRLSEKRARVDSLKKVTKGYAVTGFFGDTLFLLYSRSGSFSPKDRAEAVNKRIEKLGSSIDFDINSLKIENAENTYDIIMGESIIMSINETDALWNNTSKDELAKDYRDVINAEVLKYKEETNYLNLAMKIGLAILVLLIIAALIKYK